MKKNKICNKETKVSKTIELNDRDYLEDMMETEKNIALNMTIAMNEASNEPLFKELYKIFDSNKGAGRNLFELAFQKGWYTLEEAEPKKVEEKLKSLKEKYDEFYKIDE